MRAPSRSIEDILDDVYRLIAPLNLFMSPESCRAETLLCIERVKQDKAERVDITWGGYKAKIAAHREALLAARKTALALVDFGEMLGWYVEDIISQLDAELDRIKRHDEDLAGSPQYQNSKRYTHGPKDHDAQSAANWTLDLMFTFGVEPTLNADGVYHRLTLLVYEAAIGVVRDDLTHCCSIRGSLPRNLIEPPQARLGSHDPEEAAQGTAPGLLPKMK
jgi:hypothetical protein